MARDSAPPNGPQLPEGLEGLLFDLDGVLTRTAAVHSAAWAEMFDAFLATWPRPDDESWAPFTGQDYTRYVDGKRRDDGTRDFLASRGITLPEGADDDPAGTPTVRGLSRAKNDIVHRRFRTDPVEVFSGSVAYVRAARAAGLRTAVVSSSANTADILEVTGITDLFDARIDGVTARDRNLPGKPAPDTFWAGAAALGVAPGAAAVFEDALAGVAAGRAGGFAVVVGVDRVRDGGEHARALREHGADLVVEDLSELAVPVAVGGRR